MQSTDVDDAARFCRSLKSLYFDNGALHVLSRWRGKGFVAMHQHQQQTRHLGVCPEMALVCTTCLFTLLNLEWINVGHLCTLCIYLCGLLL